MIELYGILQEQESINAELGLGVDYYKGEPGEQGIPGKDGKTPVKGVDYFTDAEITEIKDEIAEKVQVGAKGEDGKSAYQLAVEAGYEGSEADWLASLKGTDGRNGIDGINGTNGKDGKTPVKGVDYFTTAEIQQIENEAAAKVDLSEYAKTADLSTVATSGSYNDLSDKPSIPEAYELPVASATVLGGVKVGSGLSITNGVLAATGGGTADSVDWSKVQNKPTFADVATSGSYNDLTDKPTIPEIPTNVSAFENDKGYLTEHQSLVDYAKKTEIPTVPTKVSAFENDKGYLTEHQSLEGYAKTADLATVAKTGSYNDLTNKPTIPSITGLATETYVNGKIAEIDIPTIPTNISAFTNDAGYLTEHQSLTEYAKKADIPAPYTLPTASTSTLGGVKVDGSTITIADGVISAKGGSGSTELDAYIKDASVNGNTLTLTKKDDTQVVFTPSGGSGGGNELQRIFPTNIDRGNIVSQNSAYIGKIVYDEGTDNQYLVSKDQKFAEVKATKNISPTSLLNSQSEFNKNKDWVLQWVKNNSYNVCVDGSPVFLMNSYGNMVYYYWMSDNNTITQGYIQFKDTTLNELANYNDQQSYPSISTTLITEANWQNYITAGGGSDWQTTTYIGESNLYNAREMIIYWEYNIEYRMNYYNFTYNSYLASYAHQTFNVKYDYYSNGNSSWYYDGNQINTNNMNIQVIYYKI